MASLQAIGPYKLAEIIPIHGEKSFSEIASLSGLNELDVRRIMRHSMTDHIFKEPRKGVVSHTAASRLLVEDSKVLDFVDVNSNEVIPAVLQVGTLLFSHLHK